MADCLFAHISEDGRVHSLREHLEGTAKLAAEFAGEFECAEWLMPVKNLTRRRDG